MPKVRRPGSRLLGRTLVPELWEGDPAQVKPNDWDWTGLLIIILAILSIGGYLGVLLFQLLLIY